MVDETYDYALTPGESHSIIVYLIHYTTCNQAMSALRGVWRAAAEVHTRAGDAARAALAHEALARAAPQDKRSLARLVKALRGDPARAKALAEALPPISELEVCYYSS